MKKKGIALALSLPKSDPESEEKELMEDEEGMEYEALADDIISAVRSKDTSALTSALREFVTMCGE